MYGRLGKGDKSSLNNQHFVITGDGRLGWDFMIYGRLGKGDRSSTNNLFVCDHKRW